MAKKGWPKSLVSFFPAAVGKAVSVAHTCLSSANILKLHYLGNKQWAGEISLGNFAPLNITSVPLLSQMSFFFCELFVKPGHACR